MVNPGEYYRHHGGCLYYVVAKAIHAGTNEPFVLYKQVQDPSDEIPADDTETVWTWPEEDFTGLATDTFTGEQVPRFQLEPQPEGMNPPMKMKL